MMRKNAPMLTDPSRMLDFSNDLYGFAALLTLLATFRVIYFGRVVSKVTQVQQYQKDADVRIAASNQHAAEADAHAAEAHQKASTADATAETAKAQAAAAHAQAEKARAEASAANAEAEKSKTERAALQLRVQQMVQENARQGQQIAILRENDRPRAVSPQQRAAIMTTLAPYKGEPIRIAIYAQENEAISFANQIIDTFVAAGLKVESTMMMGGTGTGLGFTFHAGNYQPPLAISIANAFRAAGIQFGSQIHPDDTPENTFLIFVGSKPKISN
jgi:flagellar biosynthesis GTPase FlhF